MGHVKPKKHLGQHFLLDQNIARKIASSLTASSQGTVIEIGAGTGVLTQYLIDAHDHFVAMDVDRESVDFLKSTYIRRQEKILLADFLKVDLAAYASPLQIVGNLPYNISSQIFFRIYDERSSVSEAVCMIQKEVAERLASSHGSKSYGILSVLLQAFFDIELLFAVPPHVFDPPPKVQSAVIRLRRNETSALSCDEKLFRRVVKEGFGKRRKTLRNALKNLNLPAALVSHPEFDLRAEQLSVEDFVLLTTKIQKSWKP
ncbi:MAG: 16S rRNA (adenine(1518)-N(6)/adenine(1519)-N(6))-dimethyltransferase RsmA [Bacteroidota bacterium]